MSIDKTTGALSGTPTARDVGTVSFTITAAGSVGAVTNMDSTLLVSTNDAPKASTNISQALSAAGPLSGPTTVAVKMSQNFQISFASGLFDSDSKLSYFATLSDHTPLPAWMSFDASSLRFAGTAPPTSIPQYFGILLIASDTPGYAASTIQFTLAISVHELYFKPLSQTVNVSKGDNVQITDIKSKLYLDQSPISGRDIKSSSADLPSWLSFDSNSFDISGTAPTELSSEDLTITAQDVYGDSAEYTIHFNVVSELFAGTMGELNITLGELFKVQLPRSILANDDEAVTVDFAALADYMHFNPITFTIFGTVPENSSLQMVQCTMLATSKDGSVKESQSFNIKLLEGTDSAPNNSSTLSGHGDTFDTTKNDKSGQNVGIIVAIVIASVCGAVVLALCIFCIFRRKKQVKSYFSPKPASPKSPRKSDISRPTFVPFGWPDIEEEDIEKGKDHDDPFLERTPEHAPKLDVNLPHDRRDSVSATDSMGDADTRILDTFGESSWGYIRDDSSPSDRPHDSMKVAVDLAKRTSHTSTNSFRKHKRRTTTVYRDQIHRSTGLPVNRRITGMGTCPSTTIKTMH
ncbi:polarity establishment/cellular polarization [Neodidymelliopsis sp. IMI 364377]|nr:polarity establishment/cellular polarization [Neodidymelliopsis sp. IMI 364377]